MINSTQIGSDRQGKGAESASIYGTPGGQSLDGDESSHQSFDLEAIAPCDTCNNNEADGEEAKEVMSDAFRTMKMNSQALLD